MSRSYDFVVSSVIVIIAVVVHRMAIELFAPNTILYSVATDGTAVMNGQQHADLWFQIIAIWAPFGAAVSILLWALIREYRRQVQTVSQRAP